MQSSTKTTKSMNERTTKDNKQTKFIQESSEEEIPFQV